MPTIGNSTKPSSGWHAYSSSSNPNQEAELLTMPERGDLLELGAWVGGWSGSCRTVLAVWAVDGTMLGSCPQVTVANQGAGGPSGGNVVSVVGTLSTPVRLDAGVQFYVGFARHNSDGHQVSTAGSGTHYEGRSGGGTGPTYQTAALGAVSGGPDPESGRIGAWVENYEAVAGGRVRVAGSFVDVAAARVRQGGVWVDLDAVKIRDGGSWVDAD